MSLLFIYLITLRQYPDRELQSVISPYSLFLFFGFAGCGFTDLLELMTGCFLWYFFFYPRKIEVSDRHV